MKWTPKVWKGYWLTPLQWKVVGWFLTAFAVLRYVSRDNMLANIPDIKLALICAFVPVFLWLCLCAYSRWQESIEKHKGTEKEERTRKFAFLPFFMIPLIGSGIACGLGLAFGSFSVALLGHYDFFLAEEYVIIIVCFWAFTLYCLLDKYSLRKAGNAAYFDSVEDRVAKTAETIVKKKFKDMSLEEKLELLNKLDE